MQKTYDIPDEVIDAVCYHNGYADTINDKPNPLSKSDFFDQLAYRDWKNITIAYQIRMASDNALKNISASVTNLGEK